MTSRDATLDELTRTAVIGDALAHTLQPRHVTMISLGGIIGAGIFVGSSSAIHIAGPGVLFTYALCGLLVFVIMRMLGEMAMARPGVGSFTGYAALGLGPWAGFVAGWLYFYFWVVTIAVEALAGANVLAGLLSLPAGSPHWPLSGGLIILMMLVNLTSVRTYGECEFWFAAVKVATITGFILLGLVFIFGFGPGPGALAAGFRNHGGPFPLGLGAVFSAIPVVIFSMMGSEVATIAAVETEHPARNVVRAARTVTLRILFFYLGSIAVIVAIVPWDSIVQGFSPFASVMRVIHVPGAAAFMDLVVFTAVTSCLNSAIYVTSRMLFEMAGRGDAPVLFAALSRSRTPMLAILVSCLAGFAIVLTSIASPDHVFTFLLQSSGAIILSVYLLIALAQIALRRRMEATGELLQVKVWLFPWVSYALIVGIVAVFVMMAFAPDQKIQVALCAAIFLFALAIHVLWRRR